MVSLAGASVALIILIDLATGQGPPALNSYLGPPSNQYLRPPMMQDMSYMSMPRGEYDEKPSGKIVDEKEYAGKDKNKDDEEKFYGKDSLGKDKDGTTPSPGVFSSFQNSMSDAWKSLTNLGRHTRNVEESNHEEDEKRDESYIYFKIPKSLVCDN